MKIRKFCSITNGVYKASLTTEDWSEGDLDIMAKFGEPEIDIGGSFTGPPAFSLSSNLVLVMSDSPFTQSFDSRDDDAQVFDVTVTAATVGSDLDGEHFLLSTPTTDYYVWFDVDDGSADPAPSGATAIEVDVAAADTDTVIAGKMQAAIHAVTGLTATVSSLVVTVTNSVAGDATNPADVDTGFSISVTAQGVSADDQANVWQAEMVSRITSAVLTMRTQTDDFSREEVTNV